MWLRHKTREEWLFTFILCVLCAIMTMAIGLIVGVIAMSMVWVMVILLSLL